MLVRAGAFASPCLVGVVEEGLAIVCQDGASGGDGDGGVVLGWCCAGGDLRVADCYMAVVVTCCSNGPLCANAGCCGL